MYGKIKEYLQQELADIKKAGLYKSERVITSPQRAEIEVAGRPVLNFCANNYLGLSDNPRLIQAAKKAMDLRGFGMSSVRFICGCQDPLCRVLRCKRRCLRTPFYRTGRHYLRCPEPCFHYRRRAALEGCAVPLCECRYGGARRLPEKSTGPALPHYLYRRRVLDGRECRSAR